MACYVALLRGVNVGGKNLMPMRTLAALFADAGCGSVRTYIQSGNVLFDASTSAAARVPLLVSKAIAKQLGFAAPVILRSAAELAQVVAGCPFVPARDDIQTLSVLFLREVPAASGVKALDPARSPPDEFAVRGKHVYLHCPGGFARTKLTNDYFDRKLATVSTGRNWRTIVKLAELASAPRIKS